MKILRFKYNFIILVVLITLLGFGARLYKLNSPIADWHSWRQADTAAVTRNFIKDGFNPLYPQYDALNPLNSIGHNPNRYFFAEFPIYNIITYYFYLVFGVSSSYMRLVSAIFSALTIPVLFLLVRKYSNQRVAFMASFVFAFLPYNIYYGRVTMPDPMHIFCSVLALYLVTKWIEKENIFLAILAGIAYSLTILTKPYGLILLLPISLLIIRKWKFSVYKKISIYIFALIALVPFLLWRHHINQHPEGMFATDWLYNQGNIRFTGAYFRWLIYDRMNRLIFATGGFVLLFIGLVTTGIKKESLFYFSWLLGIIIFFVVIAKGNVTHDYYQMPIVPIGSIFIALGIEYILARKTNFLNYIFGLCLALSLVLMMFAFGWYEVRGYYNINHPEIVEAGKAVDMLLPKNAIVIAPYDNDSAFLYQTNRHGYSYGGDKIQKYINEGAQYLVSVNFDDVTNYWMQKCMVVLKTDKFVIVNLTVCKPDTKTVISRL